MTDFAPRPSRQGTRRARSGGVATTNRAGQSTRRNPLVLRGAAVVIVVGLVVFGLAVYHHRTESAYADRGVLTTGTIAGGSVLSGADVLFQDQRGLSHRVSYLDIGGPRLRSVRTSIPLQYLADDPQVVRYAQSRLPVLGYYLMAALVLSFGFLGLYIGTYFGVPLAQPAERPSWIR